MRNAAVIGIAVSIACLFACGGEDTHAWLAVKNACDVEISQLRYNGIAPQYNMRKNPSDALRVIAPGQLVYIRIAHENTGTYPLRFWLRGKHYESESEYTTTAGEEAQVVLTQDMAKTIINEE
jgi:hypothetical protein